MTIVEKWRLMMSSFADIKAAIIEMGGTLPEGKGYNRYANAVRSIYSDTYADEYEYPKNTVEPIKRVIPVAYALELVVWCKAIKEQIRQAIIGGGVECGEAVPLSEYGNKIREISTAPQILTADDTVVGYVGKPCNYQLEASGGTPPYTWSTDAWWLYGTRLNSDGTITGTSTMSTSMSGNCSITVTDAAGKSTTVQIWLRIAKEA